MTVVVALEDQLPDASGVDRWLYAGENAGRRIEAERGPLSGIARIEVADVLQERAWALRRPFLDRLAELGVENDSVEWWASQLAARTSFTHFFDRLCMLAAVRVVLAEPQDGTTLVVCSSPALAAEVARATGAAAPEPAPSRSHGSGGRVSRVWARLAPQPLLSPMLRTRRDLDPRYRRRVLARSGAAAQRRVGGPRTALLFTWIDNRSFTTDGGYADPHLGPLAELLRDRGVEVAFVARILPGVPFAETVERLLATGETFVFPDAHLELEDYRSCGARAASFAPGLPADASVEGVPMAALARELLDAQRPAHAQALLLEPLLRRLAESGIRPERIVHTYEGHGWELALAWAAQRHLPETMVVGYENMNMSRLSLSMFPSALELSVRPLPDRIVTNGPAYRDVLLAEGVPAETVRVGCALRHRTLWETPPTDLPLRSPLRILVATEIALGPSIELVAKAAAAFSADPRFTLTVKHHPLVDRAAVTRALGDLAGRLEFADRPTLELLRESDMLLYTFTGVAFEALALGVPPVLVRAESTLDLDQLEFAANLRWHARTPDELRSVAAEIAALDAAALAGWRARAGAAARRALAPFHPDCVEAFL